MNVSPAEQTCPACKGIGNTPGDPWTICKGCDGKGTIWLPGGPSFGCRPTVVRGKEHRLTLGNRAIGEVVQIGTGHVGRVVRQSPKFYAMTYVMLIDEWTGIEDKEPTGFPSEVGVRSVVQAANATHGRQARGDHLDPLQQQKKAL